MNILLVIYSQHSSLLYKLWKKMQVALGKIVHKEWAGWEKKGKKNKK